MPRRDALIIGGGIVGAATALALAQRGRSVALLERRRPGHEQGSSHGDGRIFRFTYGRARYVTLAGEALARWRELERRAGMRLLEPAGNLDLEPASGREIPRIAACLDAHGIAYDLLEARALEARFPHLTVPDGYRGLYQGDGGVLLADRALAVLWRLAAAGGAELRAAAAVERLDVDDRRVVATLEGGRSLEAGFAVLAAGGWTGAQAEGLGLRLSLAVSREQFGHHAFAADGPDHTSEGLATVIEHVAPFALYLLPQIAVPGVKCGRHRAGPVVAPDAPRAFDPDGRRAVARWIERRFPYVDPAPMREATCLYTNTPDFDFILDRHPTLRRVVIAAGFSGHGFKFAPRIGELAADLVCDPAYAARPAFAATRFGASR